MPPGFHLITDNGGFFPHGLLPALVLVQGVVFAFASIELVGTAAGECKDPETMVPKAINSVIWRIGLFYVGSVVLLVLLLPWNATRPDRARSLPSSQSWACHISAA
ncbi:L-asparagine permease [Klebsiella pneumoniae]|uniref:L-asparagine permease n=1 Tax=Klebsiella pneumoniae TaxID=573 RepID=A0A2X3EAV8_KLEPN|nr:L-asparagine permease [Klebsiella pneumoniae]